MTFTMPRHPRRRYPVTPCLRQPAADLGDAAPEVRRRMRRSAGPSGHSAAARAGGRSHAAPARRQPVESARRRRWAAGDSPSRAGMPTLRKPGLQSADTQRFVAPLPMAAPGEAHATRDSTQRPEGQCQAHQPRQGTTPGKQAQQGAPQGVQPLDHPGQEGAARFVAIADHPALPAILQTLPVQAQAIDPAQLAHAQRRERGVGQEGVTAVLHRLGPLFDALRGDGGGGVEALPGTVQPHLHPGVGIVVAHRVVAVGMALAAQEASNDARRQPHRPGQHRHGRGVVGAVAGTATRTGTRRPGRGRSVAAATGCSGMAPRRSVP